MSARLSPGRRAMLALLRGVAAGGWEDGEGRPIPARVAREALRLVEREWTRKEAQR